MHWGQQLKVVQVSNIQKFKISNLLFFFSQFCFSDYINELKSAEATDFSQFVRSLGYFILACNFFKMG